MSHHAIQRNATKLMTRTVNPNGRHGGRRRSTSVQQLSLYCRWPFWSVWIYSSTLHFWPKEPLNMWPLEQYPALKRGFNDLQSGDSEVSSRRKQRMLIITSLIHIAIESGDHTAILCRYFRLRVAAALLRQGSIPSRLPYDVHCPYTFQYSWDPPTIAGFLEQT